MSTQGKSRSRAGCPICGKPEVAEHKPFCSQLCRDRDLISWLDERYRLPARDEDLPEDD